MDVPQESMSPSIAPKKRTYGFRIRNRAGFSLPVCALVLATIAAMAFFLAAFMQVCMQARAGLGTTLGGLNKNLVLNAALCFAAFLAVMVPVVRFASLRMLLFRYRFALGVVAVALAAVFEVSGSSLACWGVFEDVLFGIPREIRVDEWEVLTPMVFSQEWAGYAPISQIIRGTETDVTLVYAQPCWAFATLFRPFLWGYLLLGSARGLAFFWVGRLVALLLVSFQLGLLLSRKRPCFALAYALLVTFSSTVQWWFAVNGTAELFIFGQGLVLALHSYLRCDSSCGRAGLATLMAWMATGYILILYPAWQVPLFWVFLALGIGDCVAYAHEPGRHRVKMLPLVVAVVAIAASVAVVFLPAWDALEAVLGTEYPGSRSSSGGGALSYYLAWGAALFNPLQADIAQPGNAVEAVGFFALQPLGIALGIVHIVRRAKKPGNIDPYVAGLLAAGLLLLWYSLVGLPSVLASVTLLSHSFPERVAQMLGFADLLILTRLFSSQPLRTRTCLRACQYGSGLQVSGFRRRKDIAIALLVALLIAFALWVVLVILSASPLRLVFSVYLLLMLFAFAAALMLFRCGIAGAGGLIVCVALAVALSGCCVNPVQSGTSALTQSEEYLAVREIVASDESDGLWITSTDKLTDEMNKLGQLCVSAGAPCVSSVNVYPYLERWMEIDGGAALSVYNRYAHIGVVPTTGATSFELGSNVDKFTVLLNPDDAAKMGVTYWVTLQDDLDEYSTPSTSVTLLRQAGSIYIWQLDVV